MNWKDASHIEFNKYDLPGDWIKLEYYEALNILFRIENSLRIFVYIVLKNEYNDKWKELSVISDDEENYTIQAIAKKRIAQDRKYEYLGYLINSPLIHLTSGELIRIITSDSYWKHFKKYFQGSKEIIKSKLYEIGNVRNSVAHFRPIKKGDVDLIKQNSLHTMTKIENTIFEFINCSDIVPSNTSDNWYKELSSISNPICSIDFKQSKNKEWIKVDIRFNNLILESKLDYSTYKITSLNINPNSIIKHYPKFSKYIISGTEDSPFITAQIPENIQIDKRIFFTFSSKQLSINYKEIKENLEEIISNINSEISLIKDDNLARGKLVEIISFNIHKQNSSKYYYSDSNKYITKIDVDNTVEFWGTLNRCNDDFISNSSVFPWMPIEISEDKNLPW